MAKSRLIKQWSYTKKFGEPLELYASDINERPGFDFAARRIRYISFSQDSYDEETLSLSFQASASEDKPGIALRAFEEGTDQAKDGVSLELDEEEYADCLYDVVVNEKDLDEQDVLRNWLDALTDRFKEKKAEYNKWFEDKEYHGPGVVYSGETPIGLFDTLQFPDADDIKIQNCVGVFDLSQVEDPAIKFHFKNFDVSFEGDMDCEEDSVDSNDLMSYTVNLGGLKVRKTKIPEKLKKLMLLNEAGAEQYTQERQDTLAQVRSSARRASKQAEFSLLDEDEF